MPRKDEGYVSLQIGPDLRAQLEERAAEAERSLSAEIRVAIRSHLASNTFVYDAETGRTIRITP